MSDYNSGEGTKLFVYGVAGSTPKTDLEDHFARFGAVSDVFVTDKGYAFVTMDVEDEAKAAINEYNGTEFNGQEIKVEIAHGRGSRRGGGGGGGRGGFRGGDRRGGYGGDRYGGDRGYGGYGDRRGYGGGGGGYGGGERRSYGDRDGGYRGGGRDGGYRSNDRYEGGSGGGYRSQEGGY